VAAQCRSQRSSANGEFYRFRVVNENPKQKTIAAGKQRRWNSASHLEADVQEPGSFCPRKLRMKGANFVSLVLDLTDDLRYPVARSLPTIFRFTSASIGSPPMNISIALS
jgi:hypothetical protein